MSDKEKALGKIVDLAEKNSLTIDDIAAYFVRHAAGTPQGANSIVMKLLTYVGGLFIFAGISAFVALIWDDLNSAARVIITLGPGLIALIMGLAALKDERYIKAATPLFLIAAFLEPAGLFVFLSEYFDGDDAALATMVVFAPLAAQMGLLFYAKKQTSMLFFTVIYAFAFLGAAMEKLDVDGDLVATVLGLSGLLISHAINKTPHRAFVPFTYFIAAFCMAGGAFALLESAFPFDFLLIGVAAAMIYASVIAQSRSFLVASVIVMLGYLGYYTGEYFADVTGWPIALIVMGMVMLGISSYAVKLGQKIGNTSAG